MAGEEASAESATNASTVCEKQCVHTDRHETDRHRQTQADKTQTDKDRHRQTQTDADRQDADRRRQTQTRHRQTLVCVALGLRTRNVLRDSKRFKLQTRRQCVAKVYIYKYEYTTCIKMQRLWVLKVSRLQHQKKKNIYI